MIKLQYPIIDFVINDISEVSTLEIFTYLKKRRGSVIGYTEQHIPGTIVQPLMDDAINENVSQNLSISAIMDSDQPGIANPETLVSKILKPVKQVVKDSFWAYQVTEMGCRSSLHWCTK